MTNDIGPDALTLILARFNAQDRKIEEVLVETRRTNGRVTALETHNAVAVAVRKELAVVGQSEERRQVRKSDERRFAVTTAVTLVAAALGVLAGSITHLF